MAIAPLLNDADTGAALVGELINEIITGEADYSTSAEAQRLLETMRDEHPEAHAAWLEAHAFRLYHGALSTAARNRRTIVRRFAKRAKFDQAIKAGTPGLFTTWKCVVDDEFTVRRLGAMTKQDHTYVAKTYEQDAQDSVLLAAFHRFVARKLKGGQTTESVMSEGQLVRLYNQVVSAE